MINRFIILFCCLLLASACASKRTGLTKPVSRPSQKPYTVDGRRYEPLSTHEGYVQKGIASWYGPDFHGKKTSNGEVYDMHGMTAAHKTLPLGVFVKVENLDNGREAVVRVNDRGPCKGRIIDLSMPRQKLGVDIAGTAPCGLKRWAIG
jgi:rare lipoprotein A